MEWFRVGHNPPRNILHCQNELGITRLGRLKHCALPPQKRVNPNSFRARKTLRFTASKRVMPNSF